MDAALLVSICSMVVSVVAVAMAIRARRAIDVQVRQLYLPRVDQLRIANPELFELHGVRLEELQSLDVTPQEVNYVLLTLWAYEARSSVSGAPIVTDYLLSLLKQHKVRTIWEKVIRGRLMSKSSFTAAVDDLLDRS